MDPLSIATGSAGLASSCFKIVSILYTFVDDARSVDETIAALIAEVKGLSQVLDTVSKGLKHQALVGLRSRDNVNLWAMVESSLEECGKTLDKLYGMVLDISGSGGGRLGMLRRPIKQVRLNMKMKDIADFQQQVHSHYSGMQLTLGTINVCIALHSNSSQQDIAQQLTGLKSQIALAIDLAHRPQPYESGSNSDAARDAQRISRHLQKLADEAQSVHSSASTVIEGDRSTIWGGSVLGDQLSNEQYRDIRNWIPPPVNEEPIEEQSIGSGPTSDGHTALADSDSESDPEEELVAMFEERGLAKLAENNFEEAEKYLCKAISLRDGNVSKSKISLEHLKANLAVAYCFHGKWDAADSLLHSIPTSRNKLDLLAVHCLHAVSSAYFGEGNFDAANETCRKALLGKKKLLGKTHDSYYQTVLLLGSICDAKGDAVEADGWRHFLPKDWYSGRYPVSPLDYLSQHVKTAQTASAHALQNSVPSLAQETSTNASNDELQASVSHEALSSQSLAPLAHTLNTKDPLQIRRKPLSQEDSDNYHLVGWNAKSPSPAASSILAEQASSISMSEVLIPHLEPAEGSQDNVEIKQMATSEETAESNKVDQVEEVSSEHSTRLIDKTEKIPASPDSEAPASKAESRPAQTKSLEPPVNQTNTAKLCGKCKEPLGPQFLRALNDKFHLGCFTCQDCGKIVASKFFPLPDEGPNQYPLCETDYFRRLDLICVFCGCALRGSYISAKDRKWHIEHFYCEYSGCDKLFGSKESYWEAGGRIYCVDHYGEHFADKCVDCSNPILTQFVEFKGNRWHPECYSSNKNLPVLRE